MSQDIQTIKASRSAEYVTVAAKRSDLLKELDQMNEFSSEEHYKASVLHLLESSNGSISLARLELVHPNRVVLNKVRKDLKKEGLIQDTKDGLSVIVNLKKPANAADEKAKS